MGGLNMPMAAAATPRPNASSELRGELSQNGMERSDMVTDRLQGGLRCQTTLSTINRKASARLILIHAWRLGGDAKMGWTAVAVRLGVQCHSRHNIPAT